MFKVTSISRSLFIHLENVQILILSYSITYAQSPSLLDFDSFDFFPLVFFSFPLFLLLFSSVIGCAFCLAHIHAFGPHIPKPRTGLTLTIGLEYSKHLGIPPDYWFPHIPPCEQVYSPPSPEGGHLREFCSIGYIYREWRKYCGRHP